MQRTNEGASTGGLSRATLAIGIALVLVFSAVSTIAIIQLPTAYAEKGNSSADHGNSYKSTAKNQSNQTITNSTEADDHNTSKKGKGKEDHQPIKSSWEARLNQTADEIHSKHLKMNAGFSGPYTSNMTYTLNANGTADAMGNSSYVGNAELSLDMSVWKSTPGQVKMDVTGGTLMVDGQSMEVHSGHAHYWINKDRMLIVAFMIDGAYTEDNEAAIHNANQTSATNQTSTDNTADSEAQVGLSEPHVRILKLWITIPEQDAKLPTDQTANTMNIDVMSRESKLASMWFLEMHGEVALST